MPGREGLAHQPVARIGNQRRAGIRHKRDGVARREPLQNFRPHRFGIVVVIGDERRREPIMVKKLAGDACVLAGDKIRARQNLKRPQCDIAQVPDGRRHDGKPGQRRGRFDRMSDDGIAASAVGFG